MGTPQAPAALPGLGAARRGDSQGTAPSAPGSSSRQRHSQHPWVAGGGWTSAPHRGQPGGHRAMGWGCGDAAAVGLGNWSPRGVIPTFPTSSWSPQDPLGWGGAAGDATPHPMGATGCNGGIWPGTALVSGVQQLQRTPESRHARAPPAGAERGHGSSPARDAPPGEAAPHKGSREPAPALAAWNTKSAR